VFYPRDNELSGRKKNLRGGKKKERPKTKKQGGEKDLPTSESIIRKKRLKGKIVSGKEGTERDGVIKNWKKGHRKFHLQG